MKWVQADGSGRGDGAPELPASLMGKYAGTGLTPISRRNIARELQREVGGEPGAPSTLVPRRLAVLQWPTGSNLRGQVDALMANRPIMS